MNIKIFVVALSLLLVTSCSGESAQEAQAELCTDLAELKQAIANLNAISGSSTVGDLKGAHDRVGNAFGEVRESAKEVKAARADELELAYNNLDKAIKDVPNNATLAEATASISDEVVAVNAAETQMRSTANCPQ